MSASSSNPREVNLHDLFILAAAMSLQRIAKGEPLPLHLEDAAAEFQPSTVKALDAAHFSLFDEERRVA